MIVKMIVLWQSSHTTGALSGDEADIGRGRRTRGPRAQSRRSRGCWGCVQTPNWWGAHQATRLSKSASHENELLRNLSAEAGPELHRSLQSRSGVVRHTPFDVTLGSGMEFNSYSVSTCTRPLFHYGNLEIVHPYPILARRCDKFFNLERSHERSWVPSCPHLPNTNFASLSLTSAHL
jgi:hypothetical protein